VVLRLGRFRALKGPGLFFIIPVIDVVAYWIDTRVITSSFKAEKTLTKDTVPVNVDAVLFWKVLDPKKAALDVADYQSAISWASQTVLRNHKTKMSLKRCVTAQFVCSIGIAPATVELGKEALPTLSR
jgi:regulator of protease activity HflC (stomatin/prohibitin superfamily)